MTPSASTSHVHGHDHGHDHLPDDHDPGEEPVVLGPVSVLDIGGDVGAAVVVVRTEAGQRLLSRHGHHVELHACPQGRPELAFHTGVHRRPTDDRPGADGAVPVAVFPEVDRGEYSLLDGRAEVISFSVTGGRVTELEI